MKTNNKLRKALTRVKKIAASYINCHDDEIDRVMTEIVATCDSALAEPVKNCEVGTIEDQTRRYEDYCRAHTKVSGCTGCPLVGCRRCQIAWAQMPYEAKEGGNHADK